jgi:hypothetical protein
MLDIEEKLEGVSELLGCLAYMLGTPRLVNNQANQSEHPRLN